MRVFLLICGLLCLSSHIASAQCPTDPSMPPEVFVQKFYQWYLSLQAKGHPYERLFVAKPRWTCFASELLPLMVDEHARGERLDKAGCSCAARLSYDPFLQPVSYGGGDDGFAPEPKTTIETGHVLSGGRTQVSVTLKSNGKAYGTTSIVLKASPAWQVSNVIYHHRSEYMITHNIHTFTDELKDYLKQGDGCSCMQ